MELHLLCKSGKIVWIGTDFLMGEKTCQEMNVEYDYHVIFDADIGDVLVEVVMTTAMKRAVKGKR